MPPKIMSAWIIKTIQIAYRGLPPPEELKTHSTRGMAAYAKVSEVICRAASWSTTNTFIRHYSMDVTLPASQAFGSTVIAAAVAH